MTPVLQNISGNATLEDLLRTEGKAELINGRIVTFMPTGFLPGTIAGRIYRKLGDYCDAESRGVALVDSVGYAVSKLSSGRQSFCPDASYYNGPLPRNLMRFIEGPPTFAVEVRSESDYGNAAEREMAEKRADYFEAGTEVIWDVDPKSRVVRVYRKDEPITPAIFGRGEQADAEPAVAGWRLDVSWLFG